MKWTFPEETAADALLADTPLTPATVDRGGTWSVMSEYKVYQVSLWESRHLVDESLDCPYRLTQLVVAGLLLLAVRGVRAVQASVGRGGIVAQPRPGPQSSSARDGAASPGPPQAPLTVHGIYAKAQSISV